MSINWNNTISGVRGQSLRMVAKDDPILKQKCELLTEEELKTGVLSTGENMVAVLIKMASMLSETHGLGLSAPQVGIAKRFFMMFDSTVKPIMGVPYHNLLIFVNPELHRKSGITSKKDEGCLSLPDLFVPVVRSTEVEVSAPSAFYFEDTSITVFETSNEEEPKDRFKYFDLEARCFQHEFDHLNGILITDRVSKRDRK